MDQRVPGYVTRSKTTSVLGSIQREEHNHKKEHLEKIANNELKHISSWMKLNILSINYNKIKYVIITNKKEKTVCTLKIDKNIIKQNRCGKYLGVLRDSSLN